MPDLSTKPDYNFTPTLLKSRKKGSELFKSSEPFPSKSLNSMVSLFQKGKLFYERLKVKTFPPAQKVQPFLWKKKRLFLS